jgi:hypothetical protein
MKIEGDKEDDKIKDNNKEYETKKMPTKKSISK